MHPDKIHGLVCLGKTERKIRDEYLYILVCPYCSKEFEATHTQTKPRSNRKQGKDHCGCQTLIRRSHRTGKEPNNKLDDKTRTINQVFGSYKASANTKGFDFSLSYEEVEFLVLSNCFYCGEPPSRLSKLGQGRWVRDGIKVNGIDRTDSKLGYTIENVVSCCSACNYLKVEISKSSFLEHIKKIYEHLKLDRTNHL